MYADFTCIRRHIITSGARDGAEVFVIALFRSLVLNDLRLVVGPLVELFVGCKALVWLIKDIYRVIFSLRSGC